MNAPPGAVSAPRAKVMINAFPVRVFARQHSPLNAANQNIKHGIEGEAHIQSARPASAFRRRNQVFDMLPLAVGQVTGIKMVELVAHTFSFPNLSVNRQHSTTFQTVSSVLTV